jgi:hypothetical protein
MPLKKIKKAKKVVRVAIVKAAVKKLRNVV